MTTLPPVVVGLRDTDGLLACGSVPAAAEGEVSAQPEWPAFNVNHNVRVKLTDIGRAEHKAYWEPFSGGRYRAAATDADGWSTFQLWDLMSVFGPVMMMGMNVPFETEIRLDPSALPAASTSTCGISEADETKALLDDNARLREALESIAQQATIADDPQHHTLGLVRIRARQALSHHPEGTGS